MPTLLLEKAEFAWVYSKTKTAYVVSSDTIDVSSFGGDIGVAAFYLKKYEGGVQKLEHGGHVYLRPFKKH